MGVIELRTEVPGPRSRELLQRSQSTVARPIGPYADVFIARAEGSVVEDVDGNRFIDLIGGIGCLAVGHSHPKVVAAVSRQVERFSHTDFTIVPYDGYAALAERISSHCGGGRKVVFFNSGAEAVENAVKVARYKAGRPGMICFEGAFHGRSYMAMTLTSREVPVKEGFGPFVPEVYRAPYPNFTGANLMDSLRDVESLLNRHAIAGVIVEPVLGEGGFVVPPPGFLKALDERCAEAGAALILDEIQTGYGRTGQFLASEHEGVRGDLILLGKSIAAGLPLSALVGEPEWLDAPPPNSLGGTYPGNPLACAAGLAVLEVLDEQGLVERAGAIGSTLRTHWEKLQKKFQGIAEVRGLGSMVGVAFEEPPRAKAVVSEARRRGVLAVTAGREGEVIRHLAALTIPDDQLHEAMEVFEKALAAVLEQA